MTEAIGKGIAEAVPGVAGLRRLLAPNPSPMTGPGTWAFLHGKRDVVVVDPGPDDPGHLAALLASLHDGAKIVGIVVTHAHLDHSALAPALARATGAPLMAYGRASAGRSPPMRALAAAGLTAGGEGLDHGFNPDLLLADGDVVASDAGPLRVLHTPGHMGGHLCLAAGDTLLTGDHVMAWAPSLVSPPDGDMGDYMRSLAKLQAAAWRQMLPAHGAPIADGASRLEELIRHRRRREEQILAALDDGPLNLAGITAKVYHDIAPPLLRAAERNALAHLIDLEQRTLVTATPEVSMTALWKRR